MAHTDNRYLLRVWREPGGDGGPQASLRDVSDGTVRSFPGLDTLLEFLETALTEPEHSGPAEAALLEERNGTDA